MNSAVSALNAATRGRQARCLQPLPLALALAACSLLTLATPPARAQALPGGLNVVHGQAQVNTAGKTMTVTNSNGAILNWQSFNIAAGQTVRFQQAGASSQVLNRVVGKDASSIFGNLTSNGKVWLLNPNGVLFGQSARINVAGLVVSTLNLADNDFINNRYSLTTALTDMPGADIVNQGELRTTLGGRVALLGGNVRNEGLIEAPGGQVLLAAGRSIDLVDTGVPNLTLRVQAPEGEALNMGSLAAPGGRVDLQAAIVNQQGLVRADALSTGAGGEVVLRGTQAVNLAAGSVTSANGGSAGGKVMVDAGTAGTTLVDGRIEATASNGVGGDVRLLGSNVGVVHAAQVDASGATGGGQVLVGGGQQGQDTSVPNAEATFFSPDASIRADATDSGQGGRVILWSNRATRAFGSLSAQGGVHGGDGGFIETSGGWLDARPHQVSARSRAGGKPGEWLLDPNNILISDSLTGANYDGDPDFATTDDNAQIDSQSIVNVLSAGNNVTITTTSSGANTQAGDILVQNATINSFASGSTSLSLFADRDIVLDNANIGQFGSGQPLSVSLTAARNGGVGRIGIVNSSITTNGGALTLGGAATAAGSPFTGALAYDQASTIASDTTFAAGVTLLDSTLNAGNGAVFIRGASSVTTLPDAHGVTLVNSSVQGGTVLIQGWVDSPTSLAQSGVLIDEFSNVTARNNSSSAPPSATLTVEGTSINGNGVTVRADTQLLVDALVPNGVMTLTGISSSPTGVGVLIDGGGSGEGGDANLTANNGAMTVTGTNTSTGLGIQMLGDEFTGAAINVGQGINLNLVSNGGMAIDRARISGPTPAALFLTSSADLSLSNSSVTGGGPVAALTATGTLSVDSVDFDFGSAATLVQFRADKPASTGSALVLNDTTLTTAGQILLLGNSLTLSGSTLLSSAASGDAIVAFGSETPNIETLTNTATNNPFQMLGDGRWLLFANTPTSGFAPGSLAHDFHQYNASHDTLPTDSGDNFVTLGSGNGMLFAIAPTLTMQGTTNTKTYDASVNTSLAGTPTFTGLLASDQAELGDSISAVFNDPNAGTGKPVTLSAFGPTVRVDDGGGRPVYGYTIDNQITGTITPKGLVATGASAANKTYDGSTLASVAAGSLSGFVGSETVGANASGSFDTKDVGSAKTVTPSYTLVDGANGGLAINYTVAATPLSADITPAPLTIVASAADKVYDGNTLATVNYGTPLGLVGAETLLVTGSGSFDTKDAGTGKSVGGLTVFLGDGANGGLAGNYAVSTVPAGLTADITPAPLGFSSVTAANKVYDGNTLASVTLGSALGLVGAETLTLGAGGTFDTKDAGTGKTVTLNYSVADGANGGLAANYALASSPATTTADITPKSLLAGGPTAQNKVYDGSTTATVSGGPLSGLVGSETLALNASGNFDTKDVASGRIVSVAYALGDGSNGGLASNYSLANPTSSAIADITPKALQITSVSAASKVYDGNTLATVTASPLLGLVGSETLSVDSNGNFDTKDAGTGKAVSVAYGLADGANGGLAGNYTLLSAPTSTTADITPKALGFTSVTATSRAYDGSRDAEVTPGTLLGLVGSETLVVDAAGSFDTKDAGNGKTVQLSYVKLDGANGGLASNYSFAAAPASTTADITPKGLSLASVTAAGKVYDGNTLASVTASPLVGLVDGETLTLGTSGTFDTKDAGTGKSVAVGYSLADGSGGGLASNYQLSGAPASTTADITPKNVVLASLSADNKVYDGSTAATVNTGGLLGLVGDETLALAASGSFADKNVGSDKAVVLGFSLADGSNGGLAGNYTLSAPSTTRADITPATLTYAATPLSQLAGTPLLPLTGEVTGFVADESVASATSGTTSWTAQLDSLPAPPGSYAVLGSGLSAQNYVFTQAAGNQTALTLTAPPPVPTSPVSAPTETALNNSLALLTLPSPASTPSQDRVLDVLPAMQRSAQTQSYTFQSLPVASLSQSTLAALLASREGYMNNLFARSLAQLEENPALADTPSCASMRQLLAGNCLITDALVKEVADARAANPVVVAGAAAPAAAAAAMPTTPATPPAEAAAAATPAIAAAAFSFPPKRAVRNASLPQIQRKVAVLIGVDKYADARIPQLDNAVSDAQAVGKMFESSLGYETVTIPNANKRDVVLALNRLAVEMSPRDSVVIYYAGHGALVPATGLGYWQLADSNPDKPETWMSNSDINKSIAQFGATQVALISDSCYSGSLVDQRLRGGPAETDVGKLLARKAVVVMSSGGNEPVFDSGKNGHSTFAWNLMDTLGKVSNWQAGGNVFERVRFAVAKELPQRPQYGTSAAAGHQAGGDYLFEQRQLGGVN